MGQDDSKAMPTVPIIPETGLISWCPQLGKPLGKIQLQPPVDQSCPLFKLPQELLNAILSLTRGTSYLRDSSTGPSSVILEVCRTAYNLFSPSFTWHDVHAYNEIAVGYYVQDNIGYAFRRDGTFKIRYRYYKSEDDTEEGTWRLRLNSAVVEMHLEIPNDDSYQYGISRTKTLYLKQNMNKKPFEFMVIDLLPEGKEVRSYYCGVPNEETLDSPCCYSGVKDLIDSVWESSHHHQLGDDVKEEIVLKVSDSCRQPPGMSKLGILIAIAKEINNHPKWKQGLIQQEGFLE